MAKAAMITWRKISAEEWYGPGFGTVHRRDGKWFGSASAYKEVDVEPVVGPFRSAKEARYALGNAVVAARALKRPSAALAMPDDGEAADKGASDV